MESAPVIIDIEASGFGNGSYPIEVGIALSDQSTYCFLVKPEPTWKHWDQQAEKIHGISRDLIETRGIPINELAATINKLIKNTTVYSDAWSNDSSWLALLFEHADSPQYFHMDTIRSILSEEQLACWDKTKELVIEELKLQRHRASADAKIIQDTYLRTLSLAS
jgi:hypothetical protein